MKSSLRFKINLILAISIIVILTIGILANTMLSGDYYISGKKRSMVETYNDIDEAYINRTKIMEGFAANSASDSWAMGQTTADLEHIAERFDTELKSSFDRISENRNMRILILEDSGMKTIDPVTGQLQSTYNIAFYSAPSINQSQTQEEIVREFGMRSNASGENIESTDSYNIFTVEGSSDEMSYLYLQGRLSNGNLLYVRSSLQSIEESVQIANRFYILITLAVSALMMVVMYFISKSFTAPILELSDLAENMAEQKFDIMYTGNRTDEIGKMGQSMNYLSKSLERSMSELKSANVKLQADLDKKVKAEERRKVFISNVSHELKTPIALIQGYAEGLSENITEDQESREFYCSVIIDEANKMNEMVKKLLDLNRLEAGDSQVTMEHFNVTELVKNILNNSSILFMQKGAKLLFDQKEPVYAWGDTELVTEVFTNYMSNALNHVEGEMRIEVYIDDNGDTVRTSVFNTGEQIPEEELDNIWEKFYKVDKARTREYGGNGVGLSIVKAAMENMGQECGVFNRDDGVEFWFELEAGRVKETEDEGQEI